MVPGHPRTKRDKVLALILAGGKGGRLETLTQDRAKPALPFGGTLRLIDFSLSNCLHSSIKDVWVIEQYELHTLNDHLANGRPWDLDRTYSGLQVLPPSSEQDDGDDKGGFAQGNADAIYRARELIREFAPDLLLVMSADHLYKLDYRDVLDRHRVCGGEVTMVTTTVPPGDSASRYGVVQVDAEGKVTAFDYKPEHPRGDRIAAEIFVYNASRLLEVMEELVGNGHQLTDYGDELLPHFVKAGTAWEHRLESYWRDVGTLDSYWTAHMELLDQPQGLALDDADWPILTYSPQRPPARVAKTASIDNGILSPATVVAGEVVRSVLGPGVSVEAGARVEDCILLAGCVVRAGASVRCAIFDENSEVGEDSAVLGGIGKLCVVGQNVKIKRGSRIAASTQIPMEKPATVKKKA